MNLKKFSIVDFFDIDAFFLYEFDEVIQLLATAFEVGQVWVLSLKGLVQLHVLLNQKLEVLLEFHSSRRADVVVERAFCLQFFFLLAKFANKLVDLVMEIFVFLDNNFGLVL